MEEKIPEEKKREHIKEFVEQKLSEMLEKIEDRKKKVVEDLNKFQEEITLFTNDEKEVLLNGEELNDQIADLTKTIYDAEKEKKQIIEEQNLKRTKMESRVNKMIAKKFVLEAIQKEEAEWTERRIELEKAQKEQFDKLVEKYQAKKTI